MVTLADGAPVLALFAAVAPIAPDPFAPIVFTRLKLLTVIEETTLWERVARVASLKTLRGRERAPIGDGF